MGVCHSDSISKRKKRISKLFGKKKKNPAENKDKALQTIQNLDQQLKDLELKIHHYDKQAQKLTNEAKAKLKAGDMAGAKKLLTKTIRFVEQIKQLEGAQNMMEEQKMMLENQYSMKKIFETVSSTNQAIKEMRKGVSVEEIEKAREEMKDIKDAQKDMGDFFAEYAEAGNEEVDEELEQSETEFAKEMLENQDSMKKSFETVSSTNQAIKKMRKAVEEIEKVREEMEEIKDAQIETGDFFAEFAEAGNEDVDEELEQLEAKMAKEEINLPDAYKEEEFQIPVWKEDIQKEEDAFGDFFA